MGLWKLQREKILLVNLPTGVAYAWASQCWPKGINGMREVCVWGGSIPGLLAGMAYGLAVDIIIYAVLFKVLVSGKVNL